MLRWRTTSHITADISRSGGTRSAREDRGTLNSFKEKSDEGQTNLQRGDKNLEDCNDFEVHTFVPALTDKKNI